MTDKTGSGENGKRALDAMRSATGQFSSTQSATMQTAANRQTETSVDDMNNDNTTTMTAELLSLTARLRHLSALDETIGGLPVIDVNKVERIRFAIETGAYRISPQRIADKIVDFERNWH